MIKISGLIRRYSSLIIFIIVCIRVSAASPSTSFDELLANKDRLSINREELDKIYQYKLDHGIKNLSNFSAFLLRSSEKLIRQGKFEKAVEYSEYAQMLSPNYPPAYTNLGKAYWAQNRFSIFSMFVGWFKSLSATFTNYNFSVFLFANFLLFFLVAFLLVIAVFSIMSVCKYFKLLIHDMGHVFPSTFPLTLLVLWGIFIFSIPFFFHISIFLIFFFWLLLLFIYHSRKEQQIIIIYALFLLLSPFLIQLISNSLVTSSTGVFHQLYQVNEGNWDGETEEKLVKWTENHPSDVDAVFSLGLIQKRKGEYAKAEKCYKKVLEVDSDYYRALCNLANVLLATGKVDMAIETCKRCLEINQASVEGYYNLSRAYLSKYMFSEGNESFNRAKELDAKRVDYYSKIYSENANRTVIDLAIPLSLFWEETFKPAEEKKLFSSYIWERLFKGIPFSYCYSVLFIFLVFVCLVFINRNEFGFAVSCEYCGVAVCRRCRRLIYENYLCKQCAGIFKGKGEHTTSVKGKEGKMIQIEKYQKRSVIIGKILSMILPGAGHLWSGHPFRGSVVLFFFFFILLGLVYSNGIVVNPWQLSHARSYGDILIFGSLLFVLYFYSISNFTNITGRLYQFLSLIKVTRKELQIKK